MNSNPRYKQTACFIHLFAGANYDLNSVLFGSVHLITYVDDIVIFTAAKDLEFIQGHLSEDCHNLSSWFRDNELVLNLKKGKTECMIFSPAKRLNAFNGRQLALTVNGTLINYNTTSSYKYLGVNLDSSLNLESHFHILYKRAAGRFNLLRKNPTFNRQ